MRAYLLIAAMLLLAVSPSRANLIVNGGFENYTVGPNDTNFGTFVRFFSPPPNTDITGWTISGSSGGRPNNVDLTHSSAYPAFAGTQSLDMEGAVGASGVIFQSFATTPGDTYHLSFEYGNNPGGTGATMNVLVKGIGTLLNRNVSHDTSTFANMDYTLFTGYFTADSPTTTLQFSAITNSGFGIALDAVSVNGLPSCTLKDTATYDPISSTLTMKFTIGNNLGTTAIWNAWLTYADPQGTDPDTMQLLFSTLQPTTNPPKTITKSFGLPKEGTVGVLSTLSTAKNGIACSSWVQAMTGTDPLSP